jgi:methylmalonyl-CoA/ethylmalonyl-CoA epimerase
METHGLTQGVKRVDHVAIVVRDLEIALRFYRDTLGVAPSRILDFPREGVKIAFLPLGGPNGSEIELLEPTDPASGVARFLEKHGEGLHHLCLEVEDIDAALAELIAAGAAVLDTTPRPTAEGRGIFLHPKGTGGVLLELVQRMESEPGDAGGAESAPPSV